MTPTLFLPLSGGGKRKWPGSPSPCKGEGRGGGRIDITSLLRSSLALAAVALTTAAATTWARADDGPLQLTRAELPSPLRALHTCARTDETVVRMRYRFGRGQLFAVSCPRAARGFSRQREDGDATVPQHLSRWAFYVAPGEDAQGAVKLSFPMLRPNGRTQRIDTLSFGRPERTTPVDNAAPLRQRADYDPPRLYGDFRPAGGRPCVVRALWQVAGSRTRLVYWAEAQSCPPNAPPVLSVKRNLLPPGTELRATGR